jgi:putative DNA primase/helicase
MTPEWIERARNVPIEHVIDARGIKLRGKIERVGPCPVCGGEDRFGVNTQKQLFNCRVCAVGGDVISLVQFLDGVSFLDAVTTLTGEAPKTNGKGRTSSEARKVVAAEYPYHDQSGAIAFVVERIEYQTPGGSFVVKDGKRKKTFSQKRPDPDHPGEWLWNIEGVPIVPYRLPELVEAIATGRCVLIVEGERKADLLWSWGIAATCNAGGAKKWKPEHAQFLRGADVYLIPDNDDAGWEHVDIVGASLVGIAKHTRVRMLPYANAKDDIVDWANAGGTSEQLDELLSDARDWKPSSADEAREDEKARAKAREDELLDALSKMKGLDYVRQRKAAAEELQVTAKAVDDEVKARREDAVAAPLYGHWIVEPWPEPADGDSLLRDIINRIRRHVVIGHDGALVIALWIVLSWVHDEVATHSPILNINSASPECGKSTAMGLVAFLMPKCIASVDVSEAAIYRAIKRWQPSFCIDEFDSILADDDKAALRSVINSGHTRGQGVLRCIGDDKTPELFPTFAAKCLGMVGRKLPPATLSRCVFVELRRRRKDEYVEKFGHVDDNELADLRRRLRRWAIDNQDTLRDAKPLMPDELQNRRADNWALQLAISDLCSGAEDFGDKARAAAIKIEGKADSRTEEMRALAAVKSILDERKCDAVFSEDLIESLTSDPTADWAEWGKSRKPITQNQIARLLKPFGISPERIRIGEIQKRGYLRQWFEDAWARYL